jgi:hypothetical protein
MANPFFRTNPSINMQQVKNIYSMLRNSNNPEMLMNQLMQQNPQLAPTINLIKANGNYEQVFRNMCNERGINADDFMKQING